VAHACNPSHSGGGDQEDCSSKPARANSSQDPILKKPFTKKGWWSSSPSIAKKERERERERETETERQTETETERVLVDFVLHGN
jgi:NADPH-dependent ferric siderophore reductase